MKRVCKIFIISLLVFLMTACSKSTAEKWQDQYDLGMRYLAEEDYEAAVAAFTTAIEIDPNQALAYIGRGNAYTGNGDSDGNLEAALTDYQKAYSLDETNAEVYLGIADIYMRQNEYLKAINILYESLHRVGEDDRIEKEISDNQKNMIMELEEKFSGIGENNMTYAERREIFTPMIAELEEYIENDPTNWSFYYYLGNIYLNLGDMDSCLDIRSRGYDVTGKMHLNPEGCSYLEDTTGQTWVLDSYGRGIACNDDVQRLRTYGTGFEITHSEQISSDGSATVWEYEYDAEGRLSRVEEYGSDQKLTWVEEYQYNNDDTYIVYETFADSDAQNYAVLRRNEYGAVVEHKRYDSDGNLLQDVLAE